MVDWPGEDLSMVAFLKRLIMGDQTDVADEVGRIDETDRLRVATCAIMLEIANSDDEFTDDERDRIVEILKGKFDLSEDEALELMEVARERIDRSIDIWGFTDTINRVYTKEEKIRVLEAIWEIIYADGELSGHEDSLVHKLSFLLGLKHRQLIDAKMKARPKK
jgi:uncharacterized tellurite resistance protein B-like protein